MDLVTAVLDPMAHHRPPVIGARLDEVDLVASLGAVLVDPHLVRLGVHDHSLGVAAPVRIDLGKVPGLAHEGVVGRNASVVVQPEHRSDVVVGGLGRMGLGRVGHGGVAPVAHGHEEIAIPVKGQTGSEVLPGAAPGLGHEDVLHACEGLPVEHAPGHGRGSLVPVVARLGIGEVHHLVRGEVRVQHHVQKAALALGPYLGDTGDGRRVQDPVADDAKSARTLGHQNVSPRQEGHGPRVHQALGHGYHPEGMVIRIHHLAGLGHGGRRIGTGSDGKEGQEAGSAGEGSAGNGVGCGHEHRLLDLGVPEIRRRAWWREELRRPHGRKPI